MKVRKFRDYAVLLGVIAVMQGGVSDADADASLSLTESVSRAEASAPATLAARREIDAEKNVTEQARARLYPRVTADGSLAYSEFETTGSQLNPETFGFEQTTREVEQTSRSYGLALSQPLYDREGWYQIARAESRTEVARQKLASSQQELTRRVAETYLNVLRERENLALAQREHDALRQRVRQLEGRRERGLSTRVDVLDAQVRQDEVAAQIERSRNAVDAAVLELERLVGDAIESLQAAPIAQLEPGSPPGDAQLERWANEAMQKSPEVSVARARLTMQREAIEVRRSGHYPSVSLQARVSDTDRTDQVVSGEQARVSLQVEMPLYAGGGVAAGVDEAQARASAERARLDAAQRRAFIEIRRTANELRTAIRSIRVLQRSLETAQARETATRRGMQSGVRDQVELLEARARVFEIRRELTNAVYDQLLAQVRIESLRGRLTEERLHEIDQRFLTEHVSLHSAEYGSTPMPQGEP